MNKTKIDWADMTWNPVTGCLHGCEYCYARKIANRFGGGKALPGGVTVELETPVYGDVNESWTGDKQVRGLIPYPYNFTPTLHAYRLDEPARKTKPQTIFVCSMADLFGEWVPECWIRRVFDACEAAPQHRYLFLTKNPSRYSDLYIDHKLPLSENMWYGSTVASFDDYMFGPAKVRTFISVEPMLTSWPEPWPDAVNLPPWIILGAETGNRKDKVVPKRWWVENAVKWGRMSGAAIFMKESLRDLMGDDFVQEFPWE